MSHRSYVTDYSGADIAARAQFDQITGALRGLEDDFLLLTAANGPLTGPLSTQNLLPALDGTYDIGSTSLFYDEVFANIPHFRVDATTGGIYGTTFGAQAIELGLTSIGDAGEHEIISSHPSGVTAVIACATSCPLEGSVDDVPTAMLKVTGEGSAAIACLSIVGANVGGATVQDAEINVQGFGAMAINTRASVGTQFAGTSTATVEISSVGKFSSMIGAVAEVAFFTDADSLIQATAQNCTISGYALAETAGDAPIIEGTGQGATVGGLAFNGRIRGRGRGAFSGGFVDASLAIINAAGDAATARAIVEGANGQATAVGDGARTAGKITSAAPDSVIQAEGDASRAVAVILDNDGTVRALGDGSNVQGAIISGADNAFLEAINHGGFARGVISFSGGIIRATGLAAVAIANVDTAVDCLASANGAWQLGPGTNAVVNAFQVGTGPLLQPAKDLVGAPAYSFQGDSDTGMYRFGANRIGFATAGVVRAELSTAALTMTFEIRGINGSATSPTYNFDSDQNTGMYRIGIDTIGLSTAGVVRLRVTTSGITVDGTITGTLATVAQPNITSVGTLTSLNVASVTISGSTVTATTLAGTATNSTNINAQTTADAASPLVSVSAGGTNTPPRYDNAVFMDHTNNECTAVDWNATSDRRLKKNIKKIQGSLAKLKRIHSYVYDRKDTGAHHIGVMAQEVRDVLPEAVGGREGRLAVSTQQLLALVISAVNELEQEVRQWQH